MCYGKPDETLAKILEAQPPLPNELGHTPLDDFEHFCAYTGCIEDEVGKDAFARAKLAYRRTAMTKTILVMRSGQESKRRRYRLYYLRRSTHEIHVYQVLLRP